MLRVAKSHKMGPRVRSQATPQDDVATLHRYGEHDEAEGLLANLNKDVAGQSLACHALAVGHNDMRTLTVEEAQARTARSMNADEVVCGPDHTPIEERLKLSRDSTVKEVDTTRYRLIVIFLTLFLNYFQF